MWRFTCNLSKCIDRYQHYVSSSRPCVGFTYELITMIKVKCPSLTSLSTLTMISIHWFILKLRFFFLNNMFLSLVKSLTKPQKPPKNFNYGYILQSYCNAKMDHHVLTTRLLPIQGDSCAWRNLLSLYHILFKMWAYWTLGRNKLSINVDLFHGPCTTF
jgi:hypothetical protein